jgi:hypothetical protein
LSTGKGATISNLNNPRRCRSLPGVKDGGPLEEVHENLLAKILGFPGVAQYSARDIDDLLPVTTKQQA